MSGYSYFSGFSYMELRTSSLLKCDRGTVDMSLVTALELKQFKKFYFLISMLFVNIC